MAKINLKNGNILAKIGQIDDELEQSEISYSIVLRL